MFQLKAGCRRFVVISSIEKLEEIARLFPSQLCGKPRTFTTDQLSVGAHNDILLRWKRRRAHMNAGLRYLERYSASDVINSEVGYMVNFLEQCSGCESLDIHNDVSFSVSRVIYRLSYGNEPDLKTQNDLKNIVHRLPDYTTTIGSFSPFDLIPPLRYLYSDKFNKFVEFNRNLSKFCADQKDKYLSNNNNNNNHKNNNKSHTLCDIKDEHSPPADLFEHFRRRWEKMTETDKTKFKLTEDSLYDTLEDIMRAGTESSSLIIQWFLLYVIAFPHVQKKMQSELDSYMSSKCKDAPDADDLTHLPYCQATLSETYRYACLNPFLKRELTDDVIYDGFKLKRNTVLLYNQWAINNDPRFFPNPRQFQPERFLDANGQYDETLTRKFMPFGFGRRRCIGIHTGRQICLLMAVAIVYKFHVNTDEQERTVDLQPISGIGLSPKNYKLRISRRREQ